MWTTSLGANYLEQDEIQTALWGGPLLLASLAMTMTVNALATGLIVFKIFKVFNQVKDNTTSEEKSIDTSGGSKYRSIVFVMIESGMVLFAVQLARLVFSVLETSTNPEIANNFVISIQGMLNVIMSSIIFTLCFTNDVDYARV